jgi:predicted DNA-binding transcriptional regulator YafY
VIPILLRSWNNRWYLIAQKEDTKEIRNFGMDRIEGLRIIQEQHDSDVNTVVDLYKQIIGISGAGGEVEQVQIETNKYGGNFLRELKLHSSQRITLLDNDTMRVEWKLVVNRELIEILCSLQQPFRIISPPSLIEKYREHLNRLLGAIQP